MSENALPKEDKPPSTAVSEGSGQGGMQLVLPGEDGNDNDDRSDELSSIGWCYLLLRAGQHMAKPRCSVVSLLSDV